MNSIGSRRCNHAYRRQQGCQRLAPTAKNHRITLKTSGDALPICIPAEPEFHTRSERRVWLALHDELPSDAWLLCNFRFSDDRRDYEVDMLVVNPGAGITVIEVKGGQLSRDPSGRWMQRGLVFAPKYVDPAEQARTAMHALVVFLNRQGLDSRRWFTWMVALPSTTLSPEFACAQLPRNRVIDATQMSELAHTVERFALGNVRQRPSREECARVLSLLTGQREAEPHELIPTVYPELVVFGWSADELEWIRELRRSAALMHYPFGLGRLMLALDVTGHRVSDGPC